MLDTLAAQGSRRDGKGRPFGRATLGKLRATTIQILEFARRRDMVTRNVAELAGMRPAHNATRPRRSLTPEEARRLFDWLGADEHPSPMLRFGLLTGLRPGELFGMLWDDVDLERRLLVVGHGMRMEGNRAVLVPMLKTSSSYRTLGLPSLAVHELRRHTFPRSGPMNSGTLQRR